MELREVVKSPTVSEAAFDCMEAAATAHERIDVRRPVKSSPDRVTDLAELYAAS